MSSGQVTETQSVVWRGSEPVLGHRTRLRDLQVLHLAEVDKLLLVLDVGVVGSQTH